MKINAFNNISFGTKKIYSAKIKDKNEKGEIQDTDVFISELEPEDVKDFEESVTELERTHFGGQIIENLKYETKNPLPNIGITKKYFVVENPKSDAVDKYKGIAIVEFTLGHMYLAKLQSLSEVPKYKDMKGVGSCIIYAVTKCAKENDLKTVSLFSEDSAIPFYRRLGFYPTNIFRADFMLHHSRFDEVTEPIEEKYSIEKRDK